MKIGFIGLGNMASAMIGGILKKGLFRKEEIYGSDPLEVSRNKLAEAYEIQIQENNQKVVEQADIIVLSVKPQFYEAVIFDIQGQIREEQIVISIAPGKTIEWIKNQFGKEVKLVRCMPNTPALVGEGCTGICVGEGVSEGQLDKVTKILESFGKAILVPEHLMDAVVGVSGSAPAYVFMMIEAMADAAVADGMPRDQAYVFAAQTVYGSAKMVLETGKHPGELKDMVCSPGGTTIQAVRVLEKEGFKSAIVEAQTACVEKARSLARSLARSHTSSISKSK